MKNYIGIPQKQAKKLTQNLNGLLSSYHIYYQNLRGCHWNIQGKEFFDLHVKFEELYTAAAVSIDEIAERILTLGGTPLHTMEDYLKNSSIQSAKQLTTAKETVSNVLNDISTLIKQERKGLELAANAGDDGTEDMLIGYLRFQEKTTWMLRAYLD